MGQKAILAGVGTVQLFDKSTGDLIVTSKTLTDSGINFSVTAEDIRGGLANGLLGQYFHDSAMGLTLTDALFSLEYLALNVGGTISVGADVMTTEQVTVTTANKLEVTNTPQPFSTLGTIGWAKKSTASDDAWEKVTFTGSEASFAGAQINDVYCVKYMKNDASAEKFTVSSAFIPSQCYALLTLPLFKASTDTGASYSSSSKIGEVQVEIPNFLLGGSQELSLTASGASTTNLSGNALATYTGAEGCDGDGYYAELKQVILNKDEFADVKSIVVANSDIELASGETAKLQVYAMYGGITAPRLIDNAKLTFTASGSSASVSTNGVVTASSTGTTTINVVVTGRTSLSASATVTVA